MKTIEEESVVLSKRLFLGLFSFQSANTLVRSLCSFLPLRYASSRDLLIGKAPVSLKTSKDKETAGLSVDRLSRLQVPMLFVCAVVGCSKMYFHGGGSA